MPHPAFAKNIARRVLATTVSPEPKKKLRPTIAAHFDGVCAYCGAPLVAKWHLDHLLSFDLGGSNHLSNRVPACPPCNEHEKRDMAWLEFLRLKCPDEDLYQRRLAKIEGWRTLHGGVPGATISESARAAYLREVEVVSAAIDGAYGRLRAAGLLGGQPVLLPASATTQQAATPPPAASTSARAPGRVDVGWTHDELLRKLVEFEEELKAAGLTEKSVKTYVNRSEIFLRWLVGDYRPRGPNS